MRFEIETNLILGSIEVADLPGIWNQRTQEYLGITPRNDSEGVLQDIHWSLGAFGYFPTYMLGNLYASQFYQQAEQSLDDLEDSIAAGNFGPLREWLTDQIHRHGTRYRSGELCEKVTGRPLDPDSFLQYITGKMKTIHGI